jgi:2-oxoglutarate ferredoxin oxidoreductase subunit alpha
MPVLAPMDVPEATELTQLAFHLAAKWRSPMLLFGDYYLAHTASSVAVTPHDYGSMSVDDWSLDGSTSGSGHARLLSPLGTTKRNERGGYDLAQHYTNCAEHTAAMLSGIEPMVETLHTDDADVVVVAFGTPAKYVRAVVARLRSEGARIGFVRPITLLPFPADALARAVDGARVLAVYENNTGQMVDDVRLAVAGRVPVEFIGRLSLDGSGFGIAPDLDSGYLRDRIEGIL